MSISDVFNYDFLFDSHAHLSTGSFEDEEVERVVDEAKKANVQMIFDMGVDLKSSKLAVERTIKFPEIKAFVGIDPEVFEVGSEMYIGLEPEEKWFEEQYEALKKLISENSGNIAGMGETGMDFYHFRNQDPETRGKSTKLQERLFRMHLDLARETKLPVSVHSRAAESSCFEIIKNYPEITGIFHSYTGSYETATKILDAGWGLGVNGIVTFKNAEPLREMYRKILGKIPQSPQSVLESEFNPQYFYSKGIFFETDAPYLSPEGKRGEKNTPANVKVVYDNFVQMLQN